MHTRMIEKWNRRKLFYIVAAESLSNQGWVLIYCSLRQCQTAKMIACKRLFMLMKGRNYLLATSTWMTRVVIDKSYRAQNKIYFVFWIFGCPFQPLVLWMQVNYGRIVKSTRAVTWIVEKPSTWNGRRKAGTFWTSLGSPFDVYLVAFRRDDIDFFISY